MTYDVLGIPLWRKEGDSRVQTLQSTSASINPRTDQDAIPEVAWSEGLDTCARPPKIRHRCHYAPFRTKSSWANDDVNLKWSTPLTQRMNVLKTTRTSPTCLGSTARSPCDATPCCRARHVRGRHSREERSLGEVKQKRSLSLE